MRYRTCLVYLLTVTLCSIVFAGFQQPPSGEKGALVKAITHWNSSCSGGQRDDWAYMVNGWYDEITNPLPSPWGHGSRAWWKDGAFTNGSIVDSDFADLSLQTWGRDWVDDTGIDEPDALMVALHGGVSSDGRWYGRVRVDEAGTGNCNAYQGDMELDYDLEFLHLSSCNSMNRPVWFGSGWSSSFKKLRQINGFHGYMWIWSPYRPRYTDFADDAFDTSIAMAFIDNLYIPDVDGPGTDECPCSRGVGATSADLWNRMFHEQYDWTYDTDPTPNVHGVIYLIGCDPAGESPLAAPGAAAPAPDSADIQAAPEGPWTRREYYEAVLAAMPEIDPKIRQAQTGPAWQDKMSVLQIADAAKDREIPDIVVGDKFLVEARNAASTKLIKMDFNRGRLRYLNQERAFDWEKYPHHAIPVQDAIEIALGNLDMLGVPRAEWGAPHIVTVGGQSEDGSRARESFEIEQLLTLPRMVNGFPVFESFARVGVSNTGDVSRSLIQDWPQFTLKYSGDLALRDKLAVVNSLTDKIFTAFAGAPAKMQSIRLGYYRMGGDYVPVAVAGLSDDQAGQLFIDPVVVLPDDRDNDGVPDAADNCPDTANRFQEDTDQDGIGDACDNCREVYNPKQSDMDHDGIGDACDDDQDPDADETSCGTPGHPIPLGDINRDCKVNLEDVRLLAAHWLVDCTSDPLDPACLP